MSEITTPVEAPEAPRKRPMLIGVALVALVASALVGANAFGWRDRVLGSATAKPALPVAGRVANGNSAPAVAEPTTRPEKTVVRSQPWWQGVTTLSGTGSMATPTFAISDAATQWRVTWKCEGGRLVVKAPKTRTLVDSACPRTDKGYATTTGNTALTVEADGPWHLQVDQQIDFPLDEPPLAAMSAPGASTIATGTFYRVDQVGTGRVTIFHLADGSYALRLEGFYVTPNTELEVRLSSLAAPHDSNQFAASPQASVTSLDVTAGSLNFTVPPGVDPTRYHSVVIWCQLTHNAYAAASLTPTP